MIVYGQRKREHVNITVKKKNAQKEQLRFVINEKSSRWTHQQKMHESEHFRWIITCVLLTLCI